MAHLRFALGFVIFICAITLIFVGALCVLAAFITSTWWNVGLGVALVFVGAAIASWSFSL